MTLDARIDTMEQELNRKHSAYRWLSYVARRVTILGALYVVLYLPMLLIQQYWKVDSVALESGTLNPHIGMNLSTLVLSPWTQSLIAAVVLGFCAGWTKQTWKMKLLVNTVLLLVTVSPVLCLLSASTSTILVRAYHGMLLLAAGLLTNRTFGYTRAWARKNFYLERLAALKYLPAGADKAKAFDKLHEAYCVDVHRDLVGDTFFVLDQASAKLQGG
ncbi:hypothetical protein GJ700_32860 [Duganella sp. FT92W]|uniref:Uncharacterized protein n=1 Tax=Pseudoduganella rivuli TaxID=2666085 RepID=A0A7X2IUY3_9BURK|nr:hypothetical protein [Pseudoduganella rivuli]MRV76513.1 hypothetical protein [Pseudoduganella rivuli]